MTQQVGITVGIPVLSSIAATPPVELTGIDLALGVDVVVTLASVLLVSTKLRSPRSCPGRSASTSEGSHHRTR